MSERARRKSIKKILNKEFFYQDPDMGTEFYVGQTPYFDLTVMMYDTQAGTVREFLVDFHTLKEIYMFSKHGLINPDPLQNTVEKLLPTVKNFVTKDGMTIIKATESKVYGNCVLGKVIGFVRDEEEHLALSLKRLAYLPAMKDSILGIDTMAIPKAAAIILIEKIQKLFKNVDIEIDLGDLGGDTDATN